MDRIVNVYDAKTNLSRLLQEVADGKSITIARAGEPIARLVPITPARRELGFARDQIWIADDFDQTPDEVIEEFER